MTLNESKLELQLEYIEDKLISISTCLLNGDYCKNCWKFSICSQVPFSKKIFKPCKALLSLEEDIDNLLNNFEFKSKELYEDLLRLLCKEQDENEELKRKIAILEKGSNDPESKIEK